VNFLENSTIALKTHKRHNRTPHRADFIRGLLAVCVAASRELSHDG
jgi:hypothetical protein